MACPWFKGGSCTSPKLGKPSSEVTGAHCRSEFEFRACQFYVEPEKKEGLLAYQTKESGDTFEARYKPYKPIHALPEEPVSGCPYFKVLRGSDGRWYALCRVMDRLLTVSEVKLCNVHWKTCPLYKNGPKLANV
ncbi:MAG: hypothetical protein GXO07_02805 [Crenarchaeota archaeon]|nr:hypothetical protein [Thermoproteota archaeon]